MGEPAGLSLLSRREGEIAQAYGEGASYREIAERFCIAPSTVRTHVQKIYRKLGVSSKVELSGLLGAGRTSAPSPVLGVGRDALTIAVLRFNTLSGGEDCRWLAEAVGNDIITELTKFPDLSVAARSSSFRLPPNALSAQKTGALLGVRYIVEGSVQFAGDTIRVSAQLVDGSTGFHLWAERFSHQADKMAALQDECVRTIAATVFGRLKLAASERSARKPASDLSAIDYVLRGQSIQAAGKSDNLRAREAFQEAVKRDSSCTRGYVGLALSHIIAEFNAWDEPGPASLDAALYYAEQALASDHTDAKAHAVLGHIHGELRDFEAAERHLTRALMLNGSDSDTYAYFGVFKEQVGQPEAAVDYFLKAMDLNRFYPGWYLWKLGTAYYFAAEYGRALEPLRQAVARNHKFKRARLALAAAYAQADRPAEASGQVASLLAHHPDCSLRVEEELYYCWPGAMKEAWLQGLREAGLPE